MGLGRAAAVVFGAALRERAAVFRAGLTAFRAGRAALRAFGLTVFLDEAFRAGRDERRRAPDFFEL